MATTNRVNLGGVDYDITPTADISIKGVYNSYGTLYGASSTATEGDVYLTLDTGDLWVARMVYNVNGRYISHNAKAGDRFSANLGSYGRHEVNFIRINGKLLFTFTDSGTVYYSDGNLITSNLNSVNSVANTFTSYMGFEVINPAVDVGAVFGMGRSDYLYIPNLHKRSLYRGTYNHQVQCSYTETGNTILFYDQYMYGAWARFWVEVSYDEESGLISYINSGNSTV